MKTLIVLLTGLIFTSAHAAQSIQSGEQAGIPDRADVEKQINKNGKKKLPPNETKEVRENQEDTDPVFYDSTTSPKEMEEEKSGY